MKKIIHNTCRSGEALMETCFAAQGTAGAGKFICLLSVLMCLFGLASAHAQENEREPFSSFPTASAPMDNNGGEPGKLAVNAAGDEYIIGVGDVIAVRVWREPELTSNMTVRTDGRISLPLVGDVDVAGKSIRILTAYLSREFSKVITEPAVSVTLVENRSKRYYLVGQIQSPGEFSIDQPITILQAIARGGGFLEWARRDRIAIIRRAAGQEERIKFDYDAFVRGKNQGDSNILISPGDTIIVP
jgi:polysaccharide biosynthesis/export protein